ncbi:MAG: right-handed parallel beta-helix repeat-containing protein [Deltaproteobacteria bacterium]|nr:right-handed parallel beta-helix repeat-containing protein [Deltaproteobacteria bacterium]
MKKLTLLVIALGLPCSFVGSAIGATLNVPSQYSTIQGAIDAASHGDEVMVSDGTYTENLDFLGKAITVRSVNGPQVTTIDGNARASVVIFANQEGAGSRLEGFTITNGKAPDGAGIHCDSYASPTITNCLITGNGNWETNHGGGISCYNYAMPIIENCTITNNTSAGHGAGIWCYDHCSPTINHCTISGNNTTAGTPRGGGGGIALQQYCSPTILNCAITDNTGFDDGGGGIRCIDNSSPQIVSCTISGNRTLANYSNGGGIYCNTYSSPQIKNCTISGNNANNSSGGGIACTNYSSATITNCTITENGEIGSFGSGIYCYRSSPTITNCTITGNLNRGIYANDIYGAGQFPVVTNTIVRENVGAEISLYSGTFIEINYSNIEGGWTGTGNIDTDPLFVDQENGDFRLQPISPCIDAGDNTAPGIPTQDFEGDPRVFDGDYDGTATADMGADEYAYSSDRAYIELDRTIYPLDVVNFINIVVMDSGLNTDPNVSEQHTGVVVIATTGGDEEAGLTLTESGSDSSMFTGSISTVCTSSEPVDGDEVLQIKDSIEDIITATYYDADDGTSSPATYADTAGTDCFPPAITNVAPAVVENTAATITWDTDENADSLVYYGTTTPPGATKSNGTLVTAHSVIVTGLTPATTYYFYVESTDEAGNQAVDDNGGACYEFTTLPVGIYYVPDDYSTIQDALNALSSSGSNEIIVRPGTYYENIDFLGKGLTVRSEAGPGATVIDGGGNGCVVSFVNGEGPSAVLDGFTVTNGAPDVGMAAGILCDGSYPIITNCLVTNNQGQGAGISNAGPTITDCTISSNTGSHGAGISCSGNGFVPATITNCIIENNVGDFCGAGIYAFGARPIITDCIIRDNDGGNEIGGGIFLMADASAIITGCTFTGNSAGYGGGLYVDVGSNATISDCIIQDNTAIYSGGGIEIGYTSRSDPTISNCVIAQNSAPDGGGIHCVDSNPVFMNCTIADNSVTQHGGGIYCVDYASSGYGPTVVNSILWGDTAAGSPNEIYLDPQGGSIDITYCDIGGGWAGEGNIQADPLFLGGGDYHLGIGSPAKDAGNNDPPNLPKTDMDGDSRIMDGIVDMGADEYPGAVVTVAHFRGTPTTGSAPLTVNFTDQSFGTVDSWFWEFGDGQTSTQQNPSHTYTYEDDFTVSLTVDGASGGDTQTRVDYVQVLEPPLAADFTAVPTAGIAPLTVDFTDQSAGTVTGWSWTFGDGESSTDQNPSHTYTSAGRFTVILDITGPGGEESERKVGYIDVAEPVPVAGFTADITTGAAPLTVQFTDQSTGEITNWFWDFGDGGSGIAVNPSHTYNEAGDYTVSLTVKGPGGEGTELETGYIHVDEPLPPVADFTASPTNGTAALTVQFTDQSSSVVTGWSWDFGDGGASTQQHPAHNYDEAGDYTVSLTVIGPGGEDTEVKESYIHVSGSICECKLVPDNTIVVRGGTLGFQASVTNNTGGTGTVLFGTKVTKPDASQTGFIWGPLQVYLNPHQTKSGHKTHTIPSGFALGSYTYHGYVGRYGNIYHECEFVFEVVSE